MDALKLNHKKILKGFTLLELIVVIIVLGILAAVAIPIYTNSVEQRRGEICINNIRTIFAAWRIYNMKNEPNYNPGGFEPLTDVNSNLDTFVDERNFGNSDTPDTPEYGFHMDDHSGESPPYLRIEAYRQGSGSYSGNSIICDYYPNGDGPVIGASTYDWSGTWPWLPADE